MRSPVTHFVLSVVVVVGCLGAAHAQDKQAYECRRGDDVGSVVVAPSGAKGCSVLYGKSAAAPTTQLWRYEAHADRCATQAQGFPRKLEGMGLTCAAVTR
jgi:hypothetical protein